MEVNALAVPLVGVLQELRATQAERDEAREAREGFRMLSQQALHKIAELQGDIDRLREQHHRLKEEYRAYRAATIGSEGKRAA